LHFEEKNRQGKYHSDAACSSYSQCYRLSLPSCENQL